MSTFGQHLRQIRQRKGIGLNEFAKELGVSPAYLSNLETGKTQTIQLDVLSKLQSELQILASEQVQTDPIDLRIIRVKRLLKDLYQNNPKATEYLLMVIEEGYEQFQIQ